MNPSQEARMRKIERASLVLRGASSALFAAVIIIHVAAIVSTLAGWSAHITYGGQEFVPSELALHSRFVLAGVGVVTAVVLLKALVHVRRLASNYLRREIFTADSARQIRQFGLSCMLWGVVKLGWTFLPLVVPAHRLTGYGVTIDPMLIGAVIVGISWFAEMAAELREESELTI